MEEELFDVVVCVGPNDYEVADRMIACAKQNVIGYRNIYLVSADPTIDVEGTYTIDETTFPFSKSNMKTRTLKCSRYGWYLQQLLKLYSGNVIPGILSNYLVIDCDTHFLNPTSFIDENGRLMYATGHENHIPYFVHMNKLHPSLKKVHPRSGIVHHMIFNNDILNEMMKLVESHHNDIKPFWELFLDMVCPTNNSGASEYEIYFNYINIYHKNNIVIRELNWKNAPSISDDNMNCHYVSIHHYMRR